MPNFEITSIKTHAEAEYGMETKITHWADITVSIPKDFDFKANGTAVLKKLADATNLIGRGE